MKFILKITISTILIAVLLVNLNWPLAIKSISNISASGVVWVILISLVQFPISTFKWKIALKIHQLDYPFFYLLKVLSIGFFFNNFLPTSIGGDAYRILKTIPTVGYKSRAVSAVLLERIIGLYSLLLIGFVSGIFYLNNHENIYVEIFIFIFLVASSIVFSIIYFLKMGKLRVIVESLQRIKKLDILFHNLEHMWKNPLLMVKLVAVSLVFQVFAVLAIGLLFSAISIVTSFDIYGLVAAFVGISSIIPLSINGIGIIEGAFAISAVQLGLRFSDAILVAFLRRILVLPLSLICGLVYIFDREKSSP